MIQKETVVTCIYDLFVDGENGKEELMERATAQHPLVYCQGEGMMLPKFEEAMSGLEKDAKFDFRIACADAYGEYDTDGVLELDKKLFFNGDGEFDSERVYVGAVVPMNTQDGQIVNAMIVEIKEDKVTIDLNHPLAGENLHFVGEVLDLRQATEAELDAIRHPHHCGHCHGNCNGGECNHSECQKDCHCSES